MSRTSKTAISYGCLTVLTIQNSALILTMRYSRTTPGPQYHTSTAVMLAEAVKCSISLVVYLTIRSRHGGKLYGKVTPQPLPHNASIGSRALAFTQRKTGSFLYLLVPSFLYAIQNNFQFIAVSNLEAATFQVLYQGKLLTTAVCAVIFLGKKLAMTQLYSIMLLSVGVVAASMPSNKQSQPSTSRSSSHPQSYSLGIAAVCIACFLSGFAGVYTESILKKTQPSSTEGDKHTKSKTCLFWLRNSQLALAGLSFAAIGCFVIDRQKIAADGFWHGYTSIVWATISLQAVGGLVVALVITYADNILKGFATSISVIISTVASSIVWRFEVTPLFLAGTVVVLVATYMYSLPAVTVAATSSEVAEERPYPLDHVDEEHLNTALEEGLLRTGLSSK